MKLNDILYQEDFVFAVCKFLEEFNQSEDKNAMLSYEPKGDFGSNINSCILAAIVHKLADDNSLNVPIWVKKPIYFLPTPIFSFDTKNKEYQDYLKNNTPHEFAIRNIFYGENVIKRV